MRPHFVNLIFRTWASVLTALGTTTLAIVLFSVFVPAVIWFAPIVGKWFSGRESVPPVTFGDAFRHSAPSAIVTAAITLGVWIVIFSVFGVRAVYRDHQELTAQLAQLRSMPKPPCPICATLPTLPNLGVSLTALPGVMSEIKGGVYSFKNRREYVSTLNNSGTQVARSVQLTFQFPFPVEAYRVVATKGTSGFTFDPSGGLGFPAGGDIQVSGCQATTSFVLRAERVEPNSNAEILLVLNDSEKPQTDSNFIGGHFIYSRDGTSVKGKYYAPLEVTNGDVVMLLEPRPGPSLVTYRTDVTMLPGACIPNDSLSRIDR